MLFRMGRVPYPISKRYKENRVKYPIIDMVVLRQRQYFEVYILDFSNVLS